MSPTPYTDAKIRTASGYDTYGKSREWDYISTADCRALERLYRRTLTALRQIARSKPVAARQMARQALAAHAALAADQPKPA